MNEYKPTEDWVRSSKPEFAIREAMDRRILADVQEAVGPVRGRRDGTRPLIRRLFMKNTMRLTAAAAVIGIAVSFFFLFGSGPGTIALASVYEKVQQAQAYTYHMHLTMTGKGEVMGQPEMEGPLDMEMTVTMSADYGMKMENRITLPKPVEGLSGLTQRVYQRPDENTMLSIVPELKVYQIVELTEEAAVKMRRQSNPREMIRQMLECDYVNLGPGEIDGVPVQGFETTDPAYGEMISRDVRATLWVDAETWLPYTLEMTIEMGNVMRVHAVASDFTWDIDVAEEDFAVVLPEDYHKLEGLSLAGGPGGATLADSMEAQAARLQSATYMKQMVMAGFAYASQNGQWPVSLEELAGLVKPEALSGGVRPDLEYIYIQPSQKYPAAESVVLYEAYDPWGEGINVGFGDGRVLFVRDEAEFLKQLGK